MPNDHSDHVHRLVRSMSRQEKRYFKLYASRHVVNGQTTQSDLFDAISAMDVYDEQALHRKFAGAAFLNRFTVTKHRLYDSILASLEAFHAASSVDARLRRTLHQTEILYQRGLYTDAERMLRSVRLLAEQHGRHPVLLEVMEWERRLMERTNYEHVQEHELEKMALRSTELREQLQEAEQLWQLKSRSFMLLYRGGKARDVEHASELGQLLADPLLQDNAEPRTPKARFMYHHIRSAVAFALNDLSSCELHLSRNSELLEKERDHFKDEPHLKLSVLSNLAYVRMRLGHFTEALEGLKEFKQLPAMLPNAPSADLEMKVFAMGASLELTVLCRMGEFDQAVEKLTAVHEGCQRYDEDLSVIRKASIRFQGAWACFGAGKYDMASRWCQLLLNERGIEQHVEVHALGRLLDLLILMETGKEDLLKYAVRNVERFLRGHDRHHRFEQAIIRYVKARMTAVGSIQKQRAHEALVLELAPLENDPLEHAVFDHFDPLCYSISKAQEKTMSEVATERARALRTMATQQPNSKREAA